MALWSSSLDKYVLKEVRGSLVSPAVIQIVQELAISTQVVRVLGNSTHHIRSKLNGVISYNHNLKFIERNRLEFC